MEHYNNEKLMELREFVDNTYAWDFILAGGDTIREKYDLLWDAIKMCSWEKNMALITNKNLAAIFETRKDFIPAYKDISCNLTFCGEIAERKCNVYKFDKCDLNEILVINGTKINLIKIFNNPFEWEDDDNIA